MTFQLLPYYMQLKTYKHTIKPFTDYPKGGNKKKTHFVEFLVAAKNISLNSMLICSAVLYENIIK